MLYSDYAGRLSVFGVFRLLLAVAPPWVAAGFFHVPIKEGSGRGGRVSIPRPYLLGPFEFRGIVRGAGRRSPCFNLLEI